MKRRRLSSSPALPALAAAVSILAGASVQAQAQESAAPAAAGGIAEQVQRFADAATRLLDEPPADAGGANPTAKPRLEVVVGSLDPRLKLAPCARIEPYLPPGTRLWGKAHVGVRCLEGPVRWNVYLPVTVKVHGRALAAAANLATGSVIGPADLVEAEVDLAAEPGPVYTDPRPLVGRTLARSVAAGAALHAGALKARQWFDAGDTVRITAQGRGFAVSSSGEALGPGIEGRSVRVRVEGGRIVSAEPAGEHAVVLPL